VAALEAEADREEEELAEERRRVESMPDGPEKAAAIQRLFEHEVGIVDNGHVLPIHIMS
jgi:hypothetical protein